MSQRLLWVGSGEETLREEIREALGNFEVVQEASISAAVGRLASDQVGAVLLSLPCAELSDEEALDEFLRRDARLPVIVHHRYGTIDDVIRLTRRGAFYVLVGELNADRLEAALNTVSEQAKAFSLAFSEDRLPWRRFVVGESRAMQQVCDVIRMIASRRCTVLISGETGTGKEVIASAIHAAGNRSHLPMVAVNCTALPANLIETELFGHTKGAFTGAHTSRMGRFEQANRGTLFLDEIGDLPLAVQAKLLRVLQEQEFQRVGSSENVRVDVRVIAASNVDLEAAVRDGRFREDLYYRLNVVPIHLPPLRERREDIPLLMDHLLQKICRQEGSAPKRLAADATDRLMQLDWPGNVRQLEHALQMALALSGDRSVLQAADFPIARPTRVRAGSPAAKPLVTVPQEGIDFDEVVSNFERSILNQALNVAGGNKARAADLLRIKRTTLLSKLKTLDERAGIRTLPSPETRHRNDTDACVLVVEEDGPVRKFIARTLESSGYRVLEAASSVAALELYSCWRAKITLVVSDTDLSGIGGDDLVSRFRASTPLLPAVLIAGENDETPIRAARFTRSLLRPFSPESLLASVGELNCERLPDTVRAVCA